MLFQKPQGKTTPKVPASIFTPKGKVNQLIRGKVELKANRAGMCSNFSSAFVPVTINSPFSKSFCVAPVNIG